MNISIFWDIATCSSYVDRCFAGIYPLSLDKILLIHLLNAGLLLDWFWPLKIEVVRYSETSVHIRTTLPCPRRRRHVCLRCFIEALLCRWWYGWWMCRFVGTGLFGASQSPGRNLALVPLNFLQISRNLATAWTLHAALGSRRLGLGLGLVTVFTQKYAPPLNAKYRNAIIAQSLSSLASTLSKISKDLGSLWEVALCLGRWLISSFISLRTGAAHLRLFIADMSMVDRIIRIF
jgi:hypothetical protein